MMDRRVGAARVSVFSNTILTAGKLFTGFLMGSTSVVAEGIHSGIDLVAAVIAYFSVKTAAQPADERHRYGHGKYENVSGAVEALLIFVAAAMIIYESVKKLRGGGEVEQLGLGALVMGVSATVNFFVSRYLMRIARETESVALEADAWHLRTDVYTSAGVFAGLLLIRITGWKILDPLVAMAVALLIVKAAWDLTRQAVGDMLDQRLPEEEEDAIREVLNRHTADIVEYHRLRTRKSGAERHIDLHIVVHAGMSVQAGHSLAGMVKAEIREKLPNSSVLIHIEPCKSACADCGADCSVPGETGKLTDRENI